jgi:EmrB/QacA subfamily drug resistance transporter
MAVVLIGSFMVVLDSTIVSVALDAIGQQFHTTTGVDWIVTAYLLAVGVVQPPTGWLADRIGRKPVFITSMGLFAAGSLCSALAPSLPLLVVFRIVQGLGGGAMVPVGMAMIYELFPPDRRGFAMGIWGVAVMGAPAIGPVLGGWFVTEFSWRLMFMINVPIGIVGVIAALRLLKNTGFREARPLDWQGTALLGAGVACVLLALSQGAAWGWQSERTLALGGVGVALLIAFGGWALRGTQAPVMDLRMFRIPTFSMTVTIICLLTLAQYGRLIFIPLELESLRHLSALHTGALLIPGAIGAAITMPISGRLADKIGAKIPVTIGLIPVAAATYYYSTLDPHSSELTLMIWLFVAGMGTGLAMMPNTVVGLNSLPAPLIATGSALRQLSRQMAGAVAVAVLTAIVASQLGGHIVFDGSHSVEHAQHAYNTAFRFGFYALIATILLALLLPGRSKSRELQRARQAEADGDARLAEAEAEA